MSEDREDPDRDAILSRRNRLIAVALSGLVSSATQACACLSPSPPPDSGAERDAGADAGTDSGVPVPCLSPLPPDAGTDSGVPVPCLSPLPPDAGPDGGGDEDAGFDSGADAGADSGVPQPCLAPPPRR